MIRTGLVALVSLALLASLPVGARAGSARTEDPAPRSVLGLEARRLDGRMEPLEAYRGQVLLIVNTASRCGYTPQYEGLQSLFEEYRGRGFSVLGFPSNDFGGQEPGSEREIGAFCRLNYGVEFPMFAKVRVQGDDAHPVFAHLTALPAPIGGPVRWNFQKYLVDRNGDVVQRFAPGVDPRDPALVAEIERLLAAADPRVQTSVSK